MAKIRLSDEEQIRKDTEYTRRQDLVDSVKRGEPIKEDDFAFLARDFNISVRMRDNSGAMDVEIKGAFPKARLSISPWGHTEVLECSELSVGAPKQYEGQFAVTISYGGFEKTLKRTIY